MGVGDFLGASREDDGRWRFTLGRHLHGAFGGAFGGVVAASVVLTARDLAPGRAPAALDVRFLRSLPAGEATAAATVLHGGRSLITVSVDVIDARQRLAARATVGLVDGDALHVLHVPAAAYSPPRSYEHGTPWSAPDGLDIPIVASLSPRALGADDRGVATSVPVPWDDRDAFAEAACLAADMCVGPPVALACGDRRIPHPNPDLSLRFTGESGAATMVGVGRLERVAGGLAAVRVEVWAGGELAAIGVSSSLLLAGGSGSPPREDGAPPL